MHSSPFGPPSRAFSLFFVCLCLGKIRHFAGGGEFPYLKTSNTTRAYYDRDSIYIYSRERERQTI